MLDEELEKQIRELFNYNCTVKINRSAKTVDLTINSNSVYFDKLKVLSELLNTTQINIEGDRDEGTERDGYYYGGSTWASIHCWDIKI